MQRPLCLLVLLLLCSCGPAYVLAQTANSEADRPLTYYLPDLNYDPAITTPEEFLGWRVGDWHVSHDLQQAYMRLVASQSDRIVLEEIGRSYEDRPLLNLIVTSPANHARLGELTEAHEMFNQRNSGTDLDDLDRVPAVLYQGFSIHGNEPSGGNAALLVIYYLAAAPLSEIPALERNLIVFDPCYNPDGFNRFASWVNSHKNKAMTPDGQDREYREAYPRGRSNHYWFDLNRDWLPVQHPESRARIAAFHRWKPNVLTDHHEMGTDATFFFMPGEPTRVHPMTPRVNQELTAAIGEYHARALDRIGSLYYSGEGYDDFYYGKGSTYPDINGAVGILFEQASSRGHLQESDNGELAFPFTVRNQVVTALSTIEAFGELRDDLLRYGRQHWNGAYGESGHYIVDASEDPGRGRELMELLQRHDLTPKMEENNGKLSRFYVRKSPFSRAVFEPITEFTDSLFYDVSTFVLPYAFNLPFTVQDRGTPSGDFGPAGPTEPRIGDERADYAYLLPWNDYYAARAAYQLLDAGVRMTVSDQPFTLADGTELARGTLVIPVANNQATGADELHRLVAATEAATGLDVLTTNTGSVGEGLMLGSRSAYRTLRKPTVALLVDGGVNSLEAGEVWHLLDQRFGIPVTKLSLEGVARADLSRYNTIVMVDGNYAALGGEGTRKLQDWLGPDRVLITQKRAGRWAAANGLAALRVRQPTPDTALGPQRPYASAARDRGGRVLGGSIYRATGDLTHPLLFGMVRPELPVFRRGSLLFEPAENPYATPLRYGPQSLLSGYSPRGMEQDLAGSAAIVVSGNRGGRTISFADNPNFRAFWYGTNRLFLNALFFGHTIDQAE